jgi:multiple antibiotic resistance protein
VETFLLVLAALFPVVNPPGSSLIFLSMTQSASGETRRFLARRVAVYAFFIMAASLLIGGLILKIYGISVPILRVAGGALVAATGWKLLNEGSHKVVDDVSSREGKPDFSDLTFYPLTLPLTTGPGTIAVMVSLGLSHPANQGDISFFVGALFATIIVALTIYVCFAYSHLVSRLVGAVGTDILVRLTAFILFCLGLQIVWSGASELLGTIAVQRAA